MTDWRILLHTIANTVQLQDLKPVNLQGKAQVTYDQEYKLHALLCQSDGHSSVLNLLWHAVTNFMYSFIEAFHTAS